MGWFRGGLGWGAGREGGRSQWQQCMQYSIPFPSSDLFHGIFLLVPIKELAQGDPLLTNRHMER